MTLQDWAIYFYLCNGSSDKCSDCLYEYSCKQKFQCGAEVFSKLQTMTKEEIKTYIDEVKNTKGITWSMNCDGKRFICDND